MRNRIVAAAAVSAVAGLAVVANAEPIHLGELGLDEAAGQGSVLFAENAAGVEGTGIYSLPLAPSSLATTMCDAEQPCFEFTIDVLDYSGVEAPAPRLRVGYDTPMRDDNFLLTVTDPEGNISTATNGNQYSVERFFEDPAPGRWHLELVPYSAEEAPFRLRFKLEAEPYEPAANAAGELLPNLRVTRLWEFTFAAPINPANGLFPPDDINPPLSAAGVEPLSCAADEMIGTDGEPAQRCLRYSFGLANVGDGIFHIRWAGDRTATESHEMVQCIEMSDGTTTANGDAGSGGFHPTHGHWHYQDIVHHELFRVSRETDPPTLVSTNNGKKIGYSPADQAMPEWHRFDQASSGTHRNFPSCAPDTDNSLGMSRGWGDAYRYQRPGNFVAFPLLDGDGEYVVITTADPLNGVRETDDTDNTAYAHLAITGNDIEVLETGLGASPWDPGKTQWFDWWAGE